MTTEEQDSTTLDREDPLETEGIPVEEDPGGEEVIVGPKENLETKEHQEGLRTQVSRVSQEREDPEETLDLMATKDQWAILGSMNAMS